MNTELEHGFANLWGMRNIFVFIFAACNKKGLKKAILDEIFLSQSETFTLLL